MAVSNNKRNFYLKFSDSKLRQFNCRTRKQICNIGIQANLLIVSHDDNYLFLTEPRNKDLSKWSIKTYQKVYAWNRSWEKHKLSYSIDASNPDICNNVTT